MCLEITESVVVQDIETTRITLAGLKDVGVQIAIDDFGTGYSVLTHLKSLPVDTLKIDKGFVLDLGTNPGDLAIVRAVIALAEAFGLELVAEGVETAARRATLLQHGCHRAQGFLLSRPVPPARRWPSSSPRRLSRWTFRAPATPEVRSRQQFDPTEPAGRSRLTSATALTPPRNSGWTGQSAPSGTGLIDSATPHSRPHQSAFRCGVANAAPGHPPVLEDQPLQTRAGAREAALSRLPAQPFEPAPNPGGRFRAGSRRARPPGWLADVGAHGGAVRPPGSGL